MVLGFARAGFSQILNVYVLDLGLARVPSSIKPKLDIVAVLIPKNWISDGLIFTVPECKVAPLLRLAPKMASDQFSTGLAIATAVEEPSVTPEPLATSM